MPRNLGEGEGVRLRGYLRALELRARLDEAVKDAGFLHVNEVCHQADAAVVVEGLGLEGVVNASRLVAHVARVVAKPGYLDLRNHDLLGVASRADHAMPAGQASRNARSLVDGVEYRGVVLGVCD